MMKSLIGPQTDERYDLYGIMQRRTACLRDRTGFTQTYGKGWGLGRDPRKD